MSRMSIGAFLSQAKQALSQSLRNKGSRPASFVIGNQSADLDSITCALVYGYIQSNGAKARRTGQTFIPITNIPSRDLRLRPELTALLEHVDLKPSDLITLDDLGNLHETLAPDKTDWTLVDHNALQGELGKHYSARVTGVIDHHDDEHAVPDGAEPRVIEKSGSCNSLLVNYCRDEWEDFAPSKAADGQSVQDENAGVALLALGAILIDTVNLKAEQKVTDHDRRAVEYLESRIKASPGVGERYDRDAFFKEINDAKSNLDGLSLEDILGKDYKQWTEGELTLGIGSVVKPVEYLMKKADDFDQAILDFAEGRQLDLFSIMTAHNDSGSFARQLLLLAVNDGAAVEVAKKFVERYAKELQLEENENQPDSTGKWVRFWEQKDLSGSRKKVGPMIREVMS